MIREPSARSSAFAAGNSVECSYTPQCHPRASQRVNLRELRDMALSPHDTKTESRHRPRAALLSLSEAHHLYGARLVRRKIGTPRRGCSAAAISSFKEIDPQREASTGQVTRLTTPFAPSHWNVKKMTFGSGGKISAFFSAWRAAAAFKS